jgi:SAM-dependent methyltransferase
MQDIKKLEGLLSNYRYRVRPMNGYPYDKHIPALLKQSEVAIGSKYNGVSYLIYARYIKGQIFACSNSAEYKKLCLDDIPADIPDLAIFEGELVNNTFFLYDMIYVKGGKIKAIKRYLIIEKLSQYSIEKQLLLHRYDPIPNDGDIFYSNIHDKKYHNLNIIKIKPIHELTVDMLHINGKLFVLDNKAVAGQADKLVELKGHTILDEEKILEDKKVYEFLFLPKGVLKVIRPRPDKTIFPNKYYVYEITKQEFENYIPIDKLLLKYGQHPHVHDIKSKQREKTPKERIFGKFMYLNHIIKKEFLEQQKGKVLDVGFGRGRDYVKYLPTVTDIYGVEPNMDNIYEAFLYKEHQVNHGDKRLHLTINYAQLIDPIPNCDFINFMFSFTYFCKSRQVFDAMMDVTRGSSKPGTKVYILTFDGEKYSKLKSSQGLSFKFVNKDNSTPAFGNGVHTDLEYSFTASNIFEYLVYKEILVSEFIKNGYGLTKVTTDFKIFDEIKDPSILQYSKTITLYEFTANNFIPTSAFKDDLPSVVECLFGPYDEKIDFTNNNIINTCKYIKSKFINTQFPVISRIKYPLAILNIDIVASEVSLTKQEIHKISLLNIFINGTAMIVNKTISELKEAKLHIPTKKLTICGINILV